MLGEALKKAIMNRKNNLEHKAPDVTIVIGGDKDEADEKLKGSDLAPSVDDQDPAKKALQPALENAADDKDGNDPGSELNESMSGSDGENPAAPTDPFHSAIAQHLAEGPMGRGPNTLAERAHAKMKSLGKKS